MPAAAAAKPVETLPQTPASDLKKLGWRGVMRTVGRVGKIVVTNHDEPEAVIVPIAEYNAILELLRAAAARDEAVLNALRHRFDERLASLREPGAGEKLRDILRQPLKLHGKVIAGEGH